MRDKVVHSGRASDCGVGGGHLRVVAHKTILSRFEWRKGFHMRGLPHSAGVAAACSSDHPAETARIREFCPNERLNRQDCCPSTAPMLALWFTCCWYCRMSVLRSWDDLICTQRAGQLRSVAFQGQVELDVIWESRCAPTCLGNGPFQIRWRQSPLHPVSGKMANERLCETLVPAAPVSTSVQRGITKSLWCRSSTNWIA
jgi:hypothetical protein